MGHGGLLWFIRQYADGLIELGDNLIDPWVRLLHDEGGKVLGLALLHLGGLQYIVVAAGVGVEPANEQAAAEGLTPVARLADIEQYVGVGGKEGLDEQEDGVAEFLVERRGLVGLVADGELICPSLPNGIVVHETDVEDLSPTGLNVVVAPVICPNLIWGEAANTCQVEWIHRLDAKLETFLANLFNLFFGPLLPLVLLADGLSEGGYNLVASAVLDCY